MKLNTKKITVLGVLTALSVVLVMLIHFPIIPAASFLEYDPADIPIYTVTLMYGPAYGLVITILVSLIQGLTVSAQSGVYGIIMHIISTGAFVLMLSIVHHNIKKLKYGFIISLICGIFAAVIIMIPANLIITPYFMGTPVEVVKSLLIPAIIPFNIVKQCINALVTAIVFIPVNKTVMKIK